MPKSIDLNTKVAKYYLNRRKGMKKTEAAISAGYADGKQCTEAEKTKEYQKLQVYFKDELMKQTTVQEIASLLHRNMSQERDIGGSNNAIKLALEKLEPNEHHEDDGDRVVVILKEVEKPIKFIESSEVR